MLGLQFDHCEQFGLSFSFLDCILNYSSFHHTKIERTEFVNSHLLDVDFTDCDVSEAVFDNCDLLGAQFENTNLIFADLSTAYNYSIAPDKNQIRKAKFSLAGARGLLDKFDIQIID